MSCGVPSTPGSVGGLRAGERVDRLVGGVGGAEEDRALDGGQLGLDLVEVGRELLADEEHLGAGVVDDLAHLGRRQPPVHVDQHRVDLRGREGQLEVVGPVLLDARDAIVGLHARGRAARWRAGCSARRARAR